MRRRWWGEADVEKSSDLWYPINLRLETLEQKGEITAYQKLTTQSLLLRVTNRLTVDYVKVREEVNRIMSGAMARTHADDILEQGQEQGREETTKLINFLWKNGRGADAERAETDKSFLHELMEKFKKGELATT